MAGRSVVAADERAEPGTHRRDGGRTGGRGRAGGTVDGAAGRAVGLRNDVAVPACRQQGRVGDVSLSTAPGPPPRRADQPDWSGALTDWAFGLWDVYRHPWVLQAASAGPPADPGQLAWLDAGLAALADTGLAERDKLAAVMAVLHYVRAGGPRYRGRPR